MDTEDYAQNMADHLMHMHVHFDWPHPDDYKKIHAAHKPQKRLRDHEITAIVDDLVTQHTLVTSEDAAELDAWVNA